MVCIQQRCSAFEEIADLPSQCFQFPIPAGAIAVQQCDITVVTFLERGKAQTVLKTTKLNFPSSKLIQTST